MKRIVTVQDISAVGKCSLTVALPIISAMGIETAVVPTALLSTHTAFSEFTFRDLTDEIVPIKEHWMREKFKFDAIYTGYLGSFRQVQIVSDMFDDLKSEDTMIIVDPAMADNGKLYKGFTEEFAKTMAGLCAKADVILPNLTEASFMLGIEYKETYDEEYVREVLKKLTGLGAKKAVLTGVSFEEGKIGAMSYDSETGEYFSYMNTYLPVKFHGTGDIFSSAVTGALMNGLSLNNSLKVAVDYTLECIDITLKEENHNWYGVNFEQATGMLLDTLKKYGEEK